MKKISLLAIALVSLSSLFANSQIYCGVASYYGAYFHGKKTASGEIYNQYKLTAAHKTLPLGTVVKVTNVTNSKSVFLRVNDRGPYIKGRIIDVSAKAADLLDFKHKGTTEVIVEVINSDEIPIDLNNGFSDSSVVLSDKTENNADTKEKLLTWENMPVANGSKSNEIPKQDRVLSDNQEAILNKNYIEKSGLLHKSVAGNFGIDLGGFISLTELIEIIKKLEQNYKQPVYFETIESSNNAVVYKLFVGNYQNRAYADALKIRLSSEYRGCAVIQY
jgi:rare lipoprotein A